MGDFYRKKEDKTKKLLAKKRRKDYFRQGHFPLGGRDGVLSCKLSPSSDQEITD